MKVGLYFGSFNPIHHGHLIIAEFMLNQANLDEVWMIVSPQNPLKSSVDLYPEKDRLRMVELAIGENERIKACDVEFGMPRPSYSINTLKHLTDTHPNYEFFLIMGTDTLQHLDKWKDFEFILMNYKILSYQRESSLGGEFAKNQKVKVYKAPAIQISATYIRGLLRMKKSIKYLVPEAVHEYLNALKENSALVSA
ncbi:MAG: nicotinate-nucleotide adenylyltransferase [Flavobacteriales bacterium]|nr:nicotinate-nucleotide adenylyltransferase [Flavobacteriales bacterium]